MIIKSIPIALALLFLSGTAAHAQNPILFENQEGLGYKDRRGNIVIPAQFILAGDFSKEGLAIVVDDRGWAFINRTGQVVIRTPFIFDGGPDGFAEGLARFTAGGKFGFFDERGKVIIAPQYDFARPFHEGSAAVCTGCEKSEAGDDGHYSIVGGRWGYIDRRGKVIVPLRFEAAEDSKDGKRRVMLNNKWRYIDKRGRTVGR